MSVLNYEIINKEIIANAGRIFLRHCMDFFYNYLNLLGNCYDCSYYFNSISSIHPSQISFQNSTTISSTSLDSLHCFSIFSNRDLKGLSDQMYDTDPYLSFYDSQN